MNKVILLLVVVSVALLAACSDNVSPTPIPPPTKPTVVYTDTIFFGAICLEKGVVRNGTDFVVNLRLHTINGRCYEFVNNADPVNPILNEYYFSLVVDDGSKVVTEFYYNKDNWLKSIGSDKIWPDKYYSSSITFSSFDVPMSIKSGFVSIDISVKDCSDSSAKVINLFAGVHFKFD